MTAIFAVFCYFPESFHFLNTFSASVTELKFEQKVVDVVGNVSKKYQKFWSCFNIFWDFLKMTTIFAVFVIFRKVFIF